MIYRSAAVNRLLSPPRKVEEVAPMFLWRNVRSDAMSALLTYLASRGGAARTPEPAAALPPHRAAASPEPPTEALPREAPHRT